LLLPGTVLRSTTQQTPLIHVASATVVSLPSRLRQRRTAQPDPVGLAPRFANGPRTGAIVSTLLGEHAQQVGRLDETLFVGDFPLPRPIVELTDELSSVGGGGC